MERWEGGRGGEAIRWRGQAVTHVDHRVRLGPVVGGVVRVGVSVWVWLLRWYNGDGAWLQQLVLVLVRGESVRV